MDVAVLLLDGVFDLGLAAMLDALTLANGFAGRVTPFTVTKIGPRRRVQTNQGLRVALDPLPRRAPELVLVPALAAKSPDELDVALARRDAQDARDLLLEWRAAGARIGAACTGTFLLASTGLLDGRAATTSWWLAAAFRERFGRVKLDDTRMIVDAGGIVTAGAALAHLDLALWVIRRKSPALARTTARYLTFDSRASQSAYVMPDHVAHSDAFVERFEAWARRHLADFTLDAAARAVGASTRTLERRVHRALGKSPLAYVQDVRVEHARHQLETSELGIDQIAARVGYRDGTTLRTLLRARTGRTLRELRGRP
jgi:transcriptional regulator GlxA family with amidase domain